MCRKVAVSELAVRVTGVASIQRRVCSPAMRPAEKTPGSFGPGVFYILHGLSEGAVAFIHPQKAAPLLFENIGEFAAFKRPAEASSHTDCHAASQLPIGWPRPYHKLCLKRLQAARFSRHCCKPPDVCPAALCVPDKKTDVFLLCADFLPKKQVSAKTWLTRRGTLCENNARASPHNCVCVPRRGFSANSAV